MKRRKRQGRLSVGTVLMLLFTILVVFSCAGFLLAIAGGDVTERAGELIEAFSVPQSTAAVQKTQPPDEPVFIFEAESAAPTAEPEATATPVPQKRTISILAAGTVYAPQAIRETVQTGAQQHDFTPVFSGVEETLGGADLSIVTLETTTAGSEKGYGNTNTPPQILDALRACGVDLISLGTERALDKGYDGLAITKQEMTSRGLSFAGVDDGAPGAATMLRIDGVQVAVLAYCYGLSEEGAEATDGDAQGELAKLDLARMRDDIAAARGEGANLVVVLPHWGTKNNMETPQAVREMARALSQAGADIIFGTHPNVPQGVERIASLRADGLVYETLVCYSLGSLLTDAHSEENTAGMAVAVDVTYDPVTRRADLGEAQITPLYIARTKVDDAPAYRVVPAEEEQALSALDDAQREAAARAAQLVRDVTGQGDAE